MRKETKMNTQELSPSTVTEFVAGAYKGSDKILGDIVTQAQQYENELNAWIDMIEVTEGLVR